MKRSFILHLDSLEILHDLSSDEAGELLKAMYYYHLGDEYNLSSHLRLLFIQFKNQFKRDENKYDETCERNRENGKKGGRPKKPKQSEETQETHSVILKPKKAYNDNDSDNKNDNVNKNIPEIEDFVAYALEQSPNVDEDEVRLKYKSWLVNGWCTNKDNKLRPIKNWKSTLLNTLPYIKQKNVVKDYDQIYYENVMKQINANK
jgi:hypothetical protein